VATNDRPDIWALLSWKLITDRHDIREASRINSWLRLGQDSTTALAAP
jgi:hypothetical protein